VDEKSANVEMKRKTYPKRPAGKESKRKRKKGSPQRKISRKEKNLAIAPAAPEPNLKGGNKEVDVKAHFSRGGKQEHLGPDRAMGPRTLSPKNEGRFRGFRSMGKRNHNAKRIMKNLRSSILKKGD